MNKRRRILLFTLPLVLGALVGGAKWKQMHPAPTQFDLQERVRLMKAKRVELYVNGGKTSLPIGEFKVALNEFFLIELKNTDQLVRVGSTLKVLQVPASSIVIIVAEHPNEPMPLGQIQLSDPTFYLGSKVQRDPAGHIALSQTTGSLHLVTDRRLRELIAKHLPAR